MALLYLSNLILNNSGVKFTEAKTNTEKALTVYTKYKYEQILLGSEMGLYNAILFSLKNGLNNNISQKSICKYNFNNKIKFYFMLGQLVVLPFTLYRTVQYINSKNIKFINFE